MTKSEEEKLYHKATETKESLELENLRLQRDLLRRQKQELHRRQKHQRILLWSFVAVSIGIVILGILLSL